MVYMRCVSTEPCQLEMIQGLLYIPRIIHTLHVLLCFIVHGYRLFTYGLLEQYDYPHCMKRSSNGNIFRVTGLCEGNPPVASGFQWRGTLWCFFMCAWTKSKANGRDAGDLRHHRAHCDVTVLASKVTLNEMSLRVTSLAQKKTCSYMYDITWKQRWWTCQFLKFLRGWESGRGFIIVLQWESNYWMR